MAALLRSGEARRFEITTEPQENPTYKTVKKPFLFEHDSRLSPSVLMQFSSKLFLGSESGKRRDTSKLISLANN